MKHKLTLQEKLDKRKYKKPNRFVWWVLYHLVVKPFLSPAHNVHVTVKDDIRKCKGPAFFVYNHQSRVDFIWETQCAMGRPINFMVGYNEFFRTHLQFVTKLLHFIPKKNFTLDLASMRAVSSIIKQNGVVCFAPEGMSSINGHNQPVVTGTGKLLKKYNIPVYLGKAKGSFLTNPKVCINDRKGKIEATMELLFTPEQLKSMTSEEIDAKLNEVLWENDYEWNKTARVKFDTHGMAAAHQHDLCYRCPTCGKEFTMIGEGNILKCTACGAGAEMDDYYDFHPFPGSIIPSDPARWHDEERKLVYQEIKNNPDFVFEEEVELGYLPPYHLPKNKASSEVCGSGKIRFDHKGIHFVGTKLGEEFKFDLIYDIVNTIGMVDTPAYFSLYVNGEYYDFFPKRPSVGKILLIVEEMHRFHGGAWKNFPWMNWIYEE